MPVTGVAGGHGDAEHRGAAWGAGAVPALRGFRRGMTKTPVWMLTTIPRAMTVPLGLPLQTK